ncbi:hypothetical protein BDR06DRAFT_1055411 [Suillus hirtellus]|nr:hypothetical protein BDR06DRAFT_1055411 [Suillus hirtellus]
MDSKCGFADTSYRVISTLVFIMEQLRANIDPLKINALSEAEFGIWETPEGMMYVDVLSSQKGEEGPKKGKATDIAHWEAELHKSLTNKKAGPRQVLLSTFGHIPQVLLKGGVDASHDDGDEALEQITLVINIIKFHCSESSSVLINLREAVQSNVTCDEVSVLIDGTLLQEVYVGNGCLQAIQNAHLTNYVWEDNGLDVPEDFVDKLMSYLTCHWPLQRLLKAKILAPKFDQYATWVVVTLAFEHLAPSFTEDQIKLFFIFLIKDEALGDRSSDVHCGMLWAGTAVIDIHGSKRLVGLLSTFEEHLGGPSATNETGDQIKEAIVILFGCVVRHLDTSDTHIPSIVD